MKRFVLATLFVGAFNSWAGLCDDTYTLAKVTQLIRTGMPNNLKSVTKTLGNDYSGIDTLLRIQAYKLPTSFTPNCTRPTPPATVSYKKKASNQTIWTMSTDNYPRIQVYDSLSPLTGFPQYHWWLGFYPENFNSLTYYFGRTKGSTSFENWYGLAYLIDSVRNTNTQIWSTTTQYTFETIGPRDSTSLDAGLTQGSGPGGGWLTKPIDANHRPHMVIQTFKLSFVGPNTSIQSRVNANGSFSFWQQGSTVWFNPGKDLSNKDQPIELCDMFGRRVSMLYPTGYLYSWNGHDKQGKAAPSGMYFARSGQKILGKFIYGR